VGSGGADVEARLPKVEDRSGITLRVETPSHCANVPLIYTRIVSRLNARTLQASPLVLPSELSLSCRTLSIGAIVAGACEGSRYELPAMERESLIKRAVSKVPRKKQGSSLPAVLGSAVAVLANDPASSERWKVGRMLELAGYMLAEAPRDASQTVDW
jgi:hypothetical protein